MDLQGSRAQVAQFKEENATLDAQIAEQSDQAESLREQISDLNNHRDKKMRDAEELVDLNLQLSSKIADLTREKTDLMHALQAQTEQFENMRNRLMEQDIARREESDRLKSTYEQLVGELEEEINRGEIRITKVLDKLSLNLVEKILFDSGSVEVKPEGLKILGRVGEILRSVKDKEIRVEGHTDNIPIGNRLVDRFPTNWELSASRATNVVRYLVEEVGIPPESLSATGLADSRPVASSETKEGRAQNRRIEIMLLPTDINRMIQELRPAELPDHQ